jgi:hypothetical protein
MKLIPNWKRSYRMFSVQAMALAAAISGAWPVVPDDLKAMLPPHLVHIVAVVLLVAGIAGRLVDQPKTK